MTYTGVEIEDQAHTVREVYDRTSGLNSRYEYEFDKLSEMKRVNMVAEFCCDRGLPPNTKTPYCNNK